MPVTRGEKRLHNYFISTENSGMKIAMYYLQVKNFNTKLFHRENCKNY